jgi:hypothetical protein
MESLQDGFPVPPRRKVDIRAAALNARRVLGIPPGRIDIPRLLDRLSAEYGIHYDVVDDHSDILPRGLEACYVPEDRTLYIASSIYREMCTGGQRAVFTLGHELGHIVLAHRRTLNRMNGAPLKVYCNSEWQANVFGAEFTMPLDQIQDGRLFTIEQLIAHFGVSRQAARVRMEDLQIGNLLKKKP